MLNDIKNALSKQQDVILLIVRVAVAVVFIQAGFGKLMNLDKTAGFFGSINIPLPYINAILAAATEFVGGILILIGFQTRLASLPLSFVMVVALITAHLGDITSIPALFNIGAFHYLLFFLILGSIGAGKYSLDAKNKT